jgi:hypothetical protein
MTGFYQPNTYLADFGYWAKMANWTEGEAAAVLLGINPHYVNPREGDLSGEASQYKEQYFGILKSAKRALDAGHLRGYPAPAEWVGWAKQLDFPIPETLVSAVEKWGASSADSALVKELQAKVSALTGEIEALKARQSDTDRELDPRERDTMLKLIFGMAVNGYGYDASFKRSNVVTDIVGDMERQGLAVSDDTIRRYLKAATDRLPDWLEKGA